MRFEIRRASLCSGQRPIESAEKEGNAWFLEVPDLDALVALAEVGTNGIIVSRGSAGAPDITIYDDYVE